MANVTTSKSNVMVAWLEHLLPTWKATDSIPYPETGWSEIFHGLPKFIHKIAEIT
jgi:hypothetical protein